MIERIFAFFDEDNQFKQVWELKLIKFDIDLDQQIKQYERYLAISHTVQDIKGNPGMRGHFYTSNLRIVWHGATDRDINLSIGLDTINHIAIKPIVTGGTVPTKYLLMIKTQSPKGNKYEFKFALYSQKDLHVFDKAIQLYKQAIQTKMYRAICTNLKINYETMKFETLLKQEIINRYSDGKYYEQNKLYDCQIVMTNVRLVILMSATNKVNSYSIPWIMIQSFEKVSHRNSQVLQLHVRGLLSNKDIFLKTENDFHKLESQFTSLTMTYAKNPILGIDSTNSIAKGSSQFNLIGTKKGEKNEFEQIFQTKINIKRTKKSYQTQNNVDGISDTFFNQELGIMMQKLPQGITRSSLWQILG